MSFLPSIWVSSAPCNSLQRLPQTWPHYHLSSDILHYKAVNFQADSFVLHMLHLAGQDAKAKAKWKCRRVRMSLQTHCRTLYSREQSGHQQGNVSVCCTPSVAVFPALCLISRCCCFLTPQGIILSTAGRSGSLSSLTPGPQFVCIVLSHAVNIVCIYNHVNV